MLFLNIEQKFEEAIAEYTRAIELDSTVSIYYGNRSFAHIKLENYGYALTDANKALELDGTYVKVCVLCVCMCVWCVLWCVYGSVL